MQKELLGRIARLNSEVIRSRKCNSMNSLTLRHSSVGRRDSKTEVCSCSGYSSEAMLCIKEVEMVESVDDLETSHSIGGHRFPNSDMLDAKIASALKKIKMNPNFKEKKVSLEEQQAQVKDRHQAVLDCSDLFPISLHGDDIRGFIQDGTKLYDQSVRFPMTVFWKVSKRCEYDSLISSAENWQCTSKKSIKIYRSRVVSS